MTGLVDGENMENEKKGGIGNAFYVVGLSNWVDDGAIY